MSDYKKFLCGSVLFGIVGLGCAGPAPGKCTEAPALDVPRVASRRPLPDCQCVCAMHWCSLRSLRCFAPGNIYRLRATGELCKALPCRVKNPGWERGIAA